MSDGLVQEFDARPTVWTVGHSTRPIEEFLGVLEAHGVECVVDVRRFPGSRRLPQYAALRVEEVAFDDEADAFLNINTREELSNLEK